MFVKSERFKISSYKNVWCFLCFMVIPLYCFKVPGIIKENTMIIIIYHHYLPWCTLFYGSLLVEIRPVTFWLPASVFTKSVLFIPACKEEKQYYWIWYQQVICLSLYFSKLLGLRERSLCYDEFASSFFYHTRTCFPSLFLQMKPTHRQQYFLWPPSLYHQLLGLTVLCLPPSVSL